MHMHMHMHMPRVHAGLLRHVDRSEHNEPGGERFRWLIPPSKFWACESFGDAVPQTLS